MNAVSEIFTIALTRARDRLAGRLIAWRVTPNQLTLAGLLWTLLAGVFLAIGLGRHGAADVPPWVDGSGNWCLWWAALFIILAGAMDILDGAVARIAKSVSEAGAFLDSTLDRFSDIALFVGIAAGFAWRNNFTYALLAVLGLGHAVVISYSRARAEDLIANCTVGYWERGERMAAILIGAACFQIPAVVWQLATLPMLTAIRRIVYTLGVVAHRRRTGEDLSVTQVKPIGTGIYRLALWRYPRRSIPYDIVTGVNILWIVAAPISGMADPIRRMILWIVG